MTDQGDRGGQVFRVDELRDAAADAYRHTFFPSPQPPRPVDQAQCLYHYTSPEGLIGILASQKLRASDTAFLNDSQEIGFAAEPLLARMARHAVEMLRPYVKDGHIPVTETGRIDSEKFDPDTISLNVGSPEYHRVCVLMATHEILTYYASTFRESVVEMNYSYVDGTTYVACLSEERDDLGQWRGYGQAGFAIGFLRHQLAHSAPVLRPVDYGEQAIDRLCNELLRHFDDRDVSGLDGCDYGCEGYIEAVSFCLPQIALVKHEAFKQEKEWRLVVPHYNLKYDEVKVRPGTQGVVPYVELGFPREAVAEIVIGPGGDFHSVRAARALLAQHNYDTTKVHIAHSAAPFRG